jgi:hypothetical protein
VDCPLMLTVLLGRMYIIVKGTAALGTSDTLDPASTPFTIPQKCQCPLLYPALQSSLQQPQ